ncbi:FliM/FliN family flagellar motor switch protein [Paracoccus sp. (in: a-proteobacteria)]|uniref:FliM/FliN family flagellar motor switch protein n=1 Tax=Paracoccus sp. TaxID=267 RepID=UPI00396C7657
MTIADPLHGNPDPHRGQGVLRRILLAKNQARLGQGCAPQLPSVPAPTPARAAATAIGRAADRLYGLPLQPFSVVPGAVTLAELPELLPDLPLVAVLQGPGDHLGTIILCPQTVAALVEVQALGRVTARALERRRPTRSDAMLCAEFIDALLTELPVEMDGIEGFEAIGGYRFLTHLEDARPLVLMLEDRPLRSLSFEMRLGGSETRQGRLLLALPQAGAEEVPVRAPRMPSDLSVGAPAQPPVPALEKPRVPLRDVVKEAPIEVAAILCRKKISLAELRSLTTGKLLSLPKTCLAEARLETMGGQLLGIGKFGEAEGCHAIRLRDPAIPLQEGAAPQQMPARAFDPNAALMAAHAPADLSGPDDFRMDDALPIVAFGQSPL